MNDIVDEIQYENISKTSCNCGNCSTCNSKKELLEISSKRLLPSIAPSEQELEIVGSVDDRKKINNTHKVPFRWICRILASYRNPSNHSEIKTFIGTGVLVSSRHVLTCGHNIINTVKFSDGRKKVKAFTWEITPGMKNVSTKPFGTYHTSIADTTDPWKLHLDPGHDLGIIKLNKRIGYQRFRKIYNAKLGYWGSKSYGKGTRLIPFNQAKQKGKKMNLSGFPIDTLKGNGNEMWWDADYIVNTRPAASSRLFYYNTDTCGGNSGSPIWLTNTSTGSRFLIGIHTGPCIIVPGANDCNNIPGVECNPFDKAPKRTSNRGVFLSAAVIRQIRDWIRNI